MNPSALERALQAFTPRRAHTITPLGEGHIHETYRVTWGPEQGAWVLQQLNVRVFSDLPAVMENIARVTAHIRARLQAGGVADWPRRVLTVRPTSSGASHWVDADGAAFRVFDEIAGALSLAQPEDERDAFEAGRGFGAFAAALRDLPEPALHETLPNFHATDQRLLQLRAALASDPRGRAASVRGECAFVEARVALAHECSDWARRGELPQRVTHNDTKLNNLLFDAGTRGALCAIDLDTVMPGHLAYDFGDLVRTAACTGGEDARDLSQLAVRLDYVQALSEGYLRELGGVITPLERRSLARGALWIVLELGMRLLTDYLDGDRYFKIHRPEHNLERARAQFALLELLEQQAEVLERIVS